MLGYEPGKLGPNIEEHFIELIHPEEREKVLAAIRDRIEEVGAYEIEFRMRTRNGPYKWILSRGKVVKPG